MADREILSLLPVFDAIMSEGSLSRAAEQLGVTQSAVSHALGRLRRLANDPLFENTGHGMRPTPRALEMSAHVRAALTHAGAAFAARELDLASLRRTFILDMGAGFDALMVPALFAEVAGSAPGVQLLVSNARGSDVFNELRHGQTEIALDFEAPSEEGIRFELLGYGPGVVLARRDHPALQKGLTEDLYFQLDHVALVWARSSKLSAVAVELERKGRQRRIPVSVPTLMAAGAVAASSDLVATNAAFVGRLLAGRFNLAIHPVPFALPPIPFYQLWHARFDDDPAHQWLRGIIREFAHRMSNGANSR